MIISSRKTWPLFRLVNTFTILHKNTREQIPWPCWNQLNEETMIDWIGRVDFKAVIFSVRIVGQKKKCNLRGWIGEKQWWDVQTAWLGAWRRQFGKLGGGWYSEWPRSSEGDKGGIIHRPKWNGCWVILLFCFFFPSFFSYSTSLGFPSRRPARGVRFDNNRPIADETRDRICARRLKRACALSGQLPVVFTHPTGLYHVEINWIKEADLNEEGRISSFE